MALITSNNSKKWTNKTKSLNIFEVKCFLKSNLMTLKQVPGN